MDILDKFEEYMLERDKSQNTIDSYKIDTMLFLKWYDKSPEFLNEINNATIKKYERYLETFSVSTISRRIVSLNQFILFLNEDMKAGIKAKGKPLKIERQDFIDDMLENDHVVRLICAAEKLNNMRAIAIMYTLFYTGARVSEMLQIKTKDIDKDSITVKGKNSKYRELLIPKKLIAEWHKYIKVRYNTSDFLFSGERGHISRQTVHRDLKDCVDRTRGIDKDIVHAHAFRHLYARNLADLGINPVVVSQLLGHSLTVTGLYIQTSKKDLLKTINKLNLRDTTTKK